MASVRVAIVGCGNIAGPYAQNLSSYSETKLVGVTDIDPARVEALAGKHGVRAYSSLEALLADERVQLIVNLTVHHAHYAVTKSCLEADKHVYSEKPLALTFAEAQELVELAERQGLRLGASPFTFLGEAQQVAWRFIHEGRLGAVCLAYAEVNWGRIESWHPAQPPSTRSERSLMWASTRSPCLLPSSARQVVAQGRVLHPKRVGKTGAPFRVAPPDFVTTMLDLEGGILVRLTTNFYVPQQSKQMGVEFHGDEGSLFLSSWQNPNASLEFAAFGKPYERVPLGDIPEMQWGRGVQEMTRAMLAGRPHRMAGEQAAHVVEILAATTESIRVGRAVAVRSSFTPPAPLERAA